MLRRAGVLSVIPALMSAAYAQSPTSAPRTYRPVIGSDLLGGYVPQGELIEVEGHVSHENGRTFLMYTGSRPGGP